MILRLFCLKAHVDRGGELIKADVPTQVGVQTTAEEDIIVGLIQLFFEQTKVLGTRIS